MVSLRRLHAGYLLSDKVWRDERDIKKLFVKSLYQTTLYCYERFSYDLNNDALVQ